MGETFIRLRSGLVTAGCGILVLGCSSTATDKGSKGEPSAGTEVAGEAEEPTPGSGGLAAGGPGDAIGEGGALLEPEGTGGAEDAGASGGALEVGTGGAMTEPAPVEVREGCERAEFGGHVYALCRDGQVLFPEARKDCEAMEMGLIRVDSQEENDWIYERFYEGDFQGKKDGSQMWLGGTDNQVEGQWRWLDDDALFWAGQADGSAQNDLFTNWGRAHGVGAQNQPNDSHNASGEDCVIIRGPDEGEGGKWTDIGCGPENSPSENADRYAWYACESG